MTSEFQSSSQTASFDLFITIAIIIVTINAVCLVSQLCPTLCNPMDVAFQAPLPMGILKAGILGGLPCPPPGDLPNQGSNPGLPHCRQILYHLSYQESFVYPYRYNCSSSCMCCGRCLIFGLLCKHSGLSFPSPWHQKWG